MRKRNRGSAIVEASLMMPWIAFLFVGTLDFGFYAYAAICTQNAARAAAIRSSTGLTSAYQANACAAAAEELNGLPNMASMVTTVQTNPTACPTSTAGMTSALPAAVPVPVTLNCSSTPKCADCTAANCLETPPPSSVQVSVTYKSIPMIPIPGILMGQMQLTRIAEMRIQ